RGRRHVHHARSPAWSGTGRTRPGGSRAGRGCLGDRRRRARDAVESNSPMTTASPSRVSPVSRRIANEAFYRAIIAAGRPPSAHHPQPWRWEVRDGVLDLLLDPKPTSEFTDPDRRLATISCGAALHHARL